MPKTIEYSKVVMKKRLIFKVNLGKFSHRAMMSDNDDDVQSNGCHALGGVKCGEDE